MRTTDSDNSSPMERIEVASGESLNDEPSESTPVTAWKAPLSTISQATHAHLRLGRRPSGNSSSANGKNRPMPNCHGPLENVDRARIAEVGQSASRPNTAVIVAAADIRWHRPAAMSSGPTTLRVSQATGTPEARKASPMTRLVRV